MNCGFGFIMRRKTRPPRNEGYQVLGRFPNIFEQPLFEALLKMIEWWMMREKAIPLIQPDQSILSHRLYGIQSHFWLKNTTISHFYRSSIMTTRWSNSLTLLLLSEVRVWDPRDLSIAIERLLWDKLNVCQEEFKWIKMNKNDAILCGGEFIIFEFVRICYDCWICNIWCVLDNLFGHFDN